MTSIHANLKQLATPIVDYQATLQLRTLYNREIKNSLVQLLHVAGEGLGISTSSQIDEVQHLPDDGKCSPHLYHRYFRLLAAIQSQDEARVANVVNSVTGVQAWHIADDHLLVNTFGYDWQNEVHQDFINDPVLGGPIVALDANELTEQQVLVSEAMLVLEKSHPALGQVFKSLVSNICFFHAGRNGELALVGASDVRTYGEVYIRVNNFDIAAMSYLLEHMIHEAGHLYLHALMAFDPLVVNSPDERYPAPIRKDPRPMYGIFHATFVLSWMLQTFEPLRSQGEAYEEAFQRFSRQYAKGYNVVSEHAKLTSHGVAMLEGFRKIATKTMYQPQDAVA